MASDCAHLCYEQGARASTCTGNNVLVQPLLKKGYFLLHTRKKVAAEMSLTVLAYNFKRVLTIGG